ncbi:MAG: RNA methyltransferase [Gemmatimonas sp.]|nr:RNA methyltransferase [Gemmatimonas sp.]
MPPAFLALELKDSMKVSVLGFNRRDPRARIAQDSDHLTTLLTSRETKELRSLDTRKGRETTGRFVAEGVRVVEDLLASPLAVRWVVCTSSLEDNERGRALVRKIDERRILRRVLRDRDFERVAKTESPQGVMAVADTPVRELSAIDVTSTRAVVLAVDGVQDPGNFGALVRSAEALGAVGVVALPGTVDPWNPKSVRAAAGSAFRLSMVSAAWEEAVEVFKRSGMPVYGAAVGGRPVSEVRGGRGVVVVGNEGAGLSEAVRKGVDGLIGVPLPGRGESLNVTAASAILLYELTR